MPIIATAAWSISKAVAAHFPSAGSGLARYAARFPGVEVNTTFYRRHRPDTFVRWAADVPEDFRFAIKMPKTISHEHRLKGIEAELDLFLADTDLEDMPVEGVQAWDEKKSPFVTVARLVAGPQTAWSEERAEQGDDGMAFSPWNGITDHRPLGAIMRLRKLAYERSAAFRSQRNFIPVTDPRVCPFGHGRSGGRGAAFNDAKEGLSLGE